MAYSPKKLKPIHLLMLREYWQGGAICDIAAHTNYTPQQVSNIINSPEAQEILRALEGDTLDTMHEIQTEAQHIAPVIFDALVKQALGSGDERTSLHAKTFIMGMAGHVPVRRISIERPNAVQEEFKGLDEDAIRKKIMGEETDPTLGPDGKVLQ